MTGPDRAAIHPLKRRAGGALRTALVASIGQATASRRPLPAFQIIGAQRAGTTSLWRWLAAHPQVRTPVLGMKGIHYFDLHAARPLRWYRAHLPTARTLARDTAVTGEASPYYLFHPEVPARVAAALPTTRFVVLLRDPVSRAVSHYHHMRDEGHEPLDTLEAALAAEPARLAGAEERLAADPSAVDVHHMHHGYVARGRYAEQLERWFAAVGRERMLVLDGGRLRTEPAELLAEVCRFIGVAPDRAPAPGPGANAGAYPAADVGTLDALAAQLAPSDERLWELIGQRWW